MDHIAITYSQDDKHLYADMSVYIKKCLNALAWEDSKPTNTPIDAPVDVGSPALSPEKHKKAMTALGMIEWLSLTVRCDVTFAHSRVAQHQSKLNDSCYLAIQRIFRYLGATYDLGIRPLLYDDYANCV